MNRQIKTWKQLDWDDCPHTDKELRTLIRQHYRREIKATLLEDQKHHENDGYAFHLPEWMPNDPAPQGFWTNYSMDRFDDDCIFDYDDGWGDMAPWGAKAYHSCEIDQSARKMNRLDYL